MGFSPVLSVQVMFPPWQIDYKNEILICVVCAGYMSSPTDWLQEWDSHLCCLCRLHVLPHASFLFCLLLFFFFFFCFVFWLVFWGVSLVIWCLLASCDFSRAWGYASGVIFHRVWATEWTVVLHEHCWCNTVCKPVYCVCCESLGSQQRM